MNIGANFSQTPLCHSSVQLANISSNVCPESAVWLTVWRTQVLQIVCTHFICEIGYQSSFVTWESVVSSPRVSAEVWPIRWLCNDGPQCSQYSGSEKSNYGHCVPFPSTICLQLITSAFLCDQDESGGGVERAGKHEGRYQGRIPSTKLISYWVVINKQLSISCGGQFESS